MPDGLTAGRTAPLLLTTDAVGGVWRYTLDLARGLDRHGVRCRVAVLGPAPNAAQRSEADGLDLVETGLALDWTAPDPAALADTVAGLRWLARDAAAVHLHAPALVGAARWPVPVVAVAHSCVGTWWRAVRGGALPPDLAWRAEATGAGLRRADAVIAPSDAHAAATRDVYGPVAIAVVHNGSDAPAGRPGGEPVVLTAGRLWDEGKNLCAIDRAAAGLEAPVWAAGSLQGPGGGSIALPHLQCLGALDAAGMRDAYAGARVYVSMAKYEPFGLSVLEAARAGLRLVLADIPSFRELWDGAATFVAAEHALSSALRHALACAGNGGAQDRSRRYTIEATAAATLAVHRQAALA